MGRLLGKLGAWVTCLCTGTMLALALVAAYAFWLGHLSAQKLGDMLAVARGEPLASKAPKPADKPAQPPSFTSIEERNAQRTTMTRHLELREQAVQNARQQLSTERDKLLKERQAFDMLVAAFRKEKEETEDRQLARGEDDVRLIWENIKPELAKDLILKMIEAEEKDQVVAILSAMRIGKQAKIVSKFKTDEEQKKLDDILRLIRQRTKDEVPQPRTP